MGRRRPGEDATPAPGWSIADRGQSNNPEDGWGEYLADLANQIEVNGVINSNDGGIGAPDLVVLGANVNDSSPETSAKFGFIATVHNQGDAQAAATTARYLRSADETIATSEDALEGTDAVGARGPNTNYAATIRLTAPSTAGTYYYGACVDAVTGESDTTDNCSASVRVDVVEAPARPDLEVGAPTVSDANPGTDAAFTLSATVSNAGDGPSAATTLRYYRSPNATVSTSNTQVGTDAVGMLAAAGTSAESILLTAPSTAGAYYYGACVDAVIDESDTTDNCSAPVQVDVDEPDDEPRVVHSITVEDTSLWEDTGNGSFVFHDNRSGTNNDPVPDAWNIYGQPLEFDAVTVYADGNIHVDIDTADDSNALVSSGLDATIRYVIRLSSGGHSVTVVHEGDIGDVKILPDNADAVSGFHDLLAAGTAGAAVVSDGPPDDEPQIVNSMTVEDTSLWEDTGNGSFVFHDNRSGTTNDPVPEAWNIYGQPLEFDAVTVYADGSVQVDIDTSDDSNALVSSGLDATVRYVIRLSSGGHSVTVVHEGDIGDVKILPDNAAEVSEFHDLLAAGTGATAVVSDDPGLAPSPDLGGIGAEGVSVHTRFGDTFSCGSSALGCEVEGLGWRYCGWVDQDRAASRCNSA